MSRGGGSEKLEGGQRRGGGVRARGLVSPETSRGAV